MIRSVCVGALLVVSLLWSTDALAQPVSFDGDGLVATGRNISGIPNIQNPHCGAQSLEQGVTKMRCDGKVMGERLASVSSAEQDALTFAKDVAGRACGFLKATGGTFQPGSVSTTIYQNSGGPDPDPNWDLELEGTCRKYGKERFRCFALWNVTCSAQLSPPSTGGGGGGGGGPSPTQNPGTGNNQNPGTTTCPAGQKKLLTGKCVAESALQQHHQGVAACKPDEERNALDYCEKKSHIGSGNGGRKCPRLYALSANGTRCLPPGAEAGGGAQGGTTTQGDPNTMTAIGADQGSIQHGATTIGGTTGGKTNQDGGGDTTASAGSTTGGSSTTTQQGGFGSKGSVGSLSNAEVAKQGAAIDAYAASRISASSAAIASNADYIAQAGASDSKSTMIGLAVGAGAMFIPPFLDDHEETVVSMVPWIIAGLYGLVVFSYQNAGNHAGQEILRKDAARSEQEAREACDGGQFVLCRELTERSILTADIFRPASERERSSIHLGPGSPLGPPFQLRTGFGWSSESIEVPEISGNVSGPGAEVVLRDRFLRVSLGGHRLSGEASNGDGYETYSLYAALGVQFGQGLLSPYLEQQIRGSSIDSDSLIVVGNSFDLTGLWSTRGPKFGSLYIDTAMSFASADTKLRGGTRVTLGWVVTNAPSLEVDALRMRPRRSYEKGYPYAFVGLDGTGAGLGFNFGQFSDDDAEVLVFQIADLRFPMSQGGSGIAFSLGNMGFRFFLDSNRRHTLTFLLPSLVAMSVDTRDIEGRTSRWAVLPIGLDYKLLQPKYQVAAGLRMPLLWFDVTEDGADWYEGLPLMPFIGGAF